MTVEELLQPRYKVIADYPGTPFDLGEILLSVGNNNYQGDDNQIYTDRYPVNYPHIFSRLEWWQHREEKDMPQYVKLSNKKIVKARDYTIYPTKAFVSHTESGAKSITLKYSTPATEEEYNNYINSLNK